MKKILFLLLISTTGFAQTQKSCCSVSSTEKFSLLASNDKFVSSHLAPLPFVFSPAKGTMVSYKTDDGKTAGAFEVKADKPTSSWIIMVHEWWGLNDYIKKEAEKLQGEVGNANVLAIDLYDGKVGTTPDEAKGLMSGLKDERSVSIIKGAIDYCGKNARISSMGWCMGGGWSLQASLLAGDKAIACVMYYGMPETNLDKLKRLHAPVLGLFAGKDEWINAKVVSTFQSDMKTAGKKLTVKTYDAKVAAADAHKEALAFLKEHLK
jgi:carboxymethylenebutenolidase